MFDYATLVDQVRRLLNDQTHSYIDSKESTVRDSYYVVLANEGWATVRPSGAIINGVPVDDSGFTVDRNLLRFETLIPANSEVLIHYDMVKYLDEEIVEFIGDAIHNIVEPVFNIDFAFGSDPEEPTVTELTVDNDLRALFVYGTVLQMMGVQISETTGDAIYIKDGDTVIDTAASSREAMRGYQPFIDRWGELLMTVRLNRASGVVQY